MVAPMHRPAVLLVAVVGLLAVLLPSSGRPAAASFPGENGRIVFSGTRDSDSPRLYTIEPDGSGLLPATTADLNDSGSVWSPDGRRIAFQRDGPDSRRDIVVVNADGSGEFKITDDTIYDNEPAWSPDGTRIIFNSGRGGPGTDLHVWDGATGQITRLTHLNDTLQPDWSPDGTRIAFTRYMGEPGKYEVFVMEADGSDVTQITFNGFDSENPSWSPDGTMIAFYSDHETFVGIYAVNLDGSGQMRLSEADDFGYRPSWSPDGTMILFDKLSRPYTMPASGGPASPLPGSVDGDFDADWQRLAAYGDANCDGMWDILDLLPVLSFIAGILPLAPCIAMGNADCSNAIDGADVEIWLRAAAQLPYELPQGCAVG